MYNGHKNWNHWNVALWLFDDERLYRTVQERLRYDTKDTVARDLVSDGLPSHTPDGAPYTYTAVRAALVGEV